MLGVDEAATLMAHLPPVGWADVATKHDLESFATVLRADFRAEMAELRGELRGEIASVRGDLRAEFAMQTRNLFFSMLGLQLSAFALLAAAQRIF